MDFRTNLKRLLIVIIASVALTACATQTKKAGKMQGDVYSGSDLVHCWWGLPSDQ
jgi:outer membrane PBP1 activator LpoA protein